MCKNKNLYGFLFFLLFLKSTSFCFGFVPGFNTVGYFQSESGTNSRSLKSCLLDSNKKIVTVGRTDDNGADNHDGLIMRFNTDGTLDKTFNGTGFIADDTVTESYFYHDMALDDQGNIVAVGRTNKKNNDSNEFYRLIVRYKPDGTRDPLFAVGGVEGGGVIKVGIAGLDFHELFGVAIDPQDRIISVGRCKESTSQQVRGLIFCHQNNGELDTTTFTGDGIIQYTSTGVTSSLFNDVVIDSNGKIIVVGQVNGNTGRMIRYTSSGTVETVFANPGGATVSMLNGIKIDSSGKIIVVGAESTTGNGIIIRYNSNGALDTTFNGTGFVSAEVDGLNSKYFNQCFIDGQGKIIVVGQSDELTTNGGDFKALIARFNSDGSLDKTFNGTGFINAETRSGIDGYEYYDCVVDEYERIIAVGRSNEATNAYNALAVRYLSNGSLDSVATWSYQNYASHWKSLGKNLSFLG